MRQDKVVIDMDMDTGVAQSICDLSGYMQKNKLPSDLVDEKLDKSRL